MKFLHLLGYGLLALMLALSIGVAFAMWKYQDIPSEQLEAKYAGLASRFIYIEGVRIHYRD